MGQKNKITRRWAKRGTRPSAPKDQRTASAYIFGAICPKDGKGAALVMPRCDTEAMSLHLAEIATQIAPGAHAALLVDQAGWHLSGGLVVPPNITLIPLPPKCPELNPQENVWQFMRDNWLSNRIFKSFNDIVDHCCDAWNKLIDQPWRIMSLFLGLVPGESSTGGTVRRKGLTLVGNRRARRALVEGAWTYRYPARVSETLRARLERGCPSPCATSPGKLRFDCAPDIGGSA